MTEQYTPEGTDQLYEAIETERHWPAEKRTIHCLITGRPYGEITEAEVRRILAALGGNRTEIAAMVDRLTLTSGPSPLWQTTMPDRLIINKKHDPHGFLIYMFNRIFRPDKWTDLALLMNWRRDQAYTWRALQSIDVKLIDRLNDSLLILSAEGLLPGPTFMPASKLSELATTEHLTAIYERTLIIQKNHKRFTPHAERKHLIHRRVVEREHGLEGMPDKIKLSLFDVMFSELLMEIDEKKSAAAKEQARQTTGIASPTWAQLTNMERSALPKGTNVVLGGQGSPKRSAIFIAPKKTTGE